MGIGGRASLALALALGLTWGSARAEEMLRPTHLEPAHACLNQKDRRALIENGSVMRLAGALHNVRNHVTGTLVRARLCHRGDSFVYVLTLLGHDGKVTRIAVDAVKGTLVGER